VRTRLRKQLTVRAYIERRVRLFVHMSEDEIRQSYQQHRWDSAEPFTEAVQGQIRRLLVEQQVNA
jgi:hypothetical protein